MLTTDQFNLSQIDEERISEENLMSLNSRKLSKGSPSYSNNISNMASKDCSFAITKLDKEGKRAGLGATIVEADHFEEVKSAASKNESNREVSTKIEDLPDLSLVEGVCTRKKNSTDMLLPSSLLLVNPSGGESPDSRNFNSQDRFFSNSFKASPKTANFSLQIKQKPESSKRSLLNKLEVGKFMSNFKSGISQTIGLILDRPTGKKLIEQSADQTKAKQDNPHESVSMRGYQGIEAEGDTQIGDSSLCEHRRVNSDSYKFPARSGQTTAQQENSGMNSARLVQQPNVATFQPFKTFDEKNAGTSSIHSKPLRKSRKSNFKSEESIKEFKKSYTIGGSKKPAGKKTFLMHELEKEVKGLKKQNHQLKTENESIKKVCIALLDSR